MSPNRNFEQQCQCSFGPQIRFMSFLDQDYGALIWIFFPHFNIPDGYDTPISNVAHYNIDSGGGEFSLDRTYQNQGWIWVWKSLPCDNDLCRQRTIVAAISKSYPRMKSSFHHWQCHLMLVIVPKTPIIWYIEPQTFLFQLHFRPWWSDSYKVVNCFKICIQYKIMDKI